MQRFLVDTDRPREEKKGLFGIFFEDINHAADGGLYAELVQNRAFEFDAIDNPQYHHLYAWEKVCRGGSSCRRKDCADKQAVTLEIDTRQPLTQMNPHYLRVTARQGNTGFCNTGFNGGIALKKGEAYRFSCYARKVSGESVSFSVCLTDKKGHIYDRHSFRLKKGGWQQYSCQLRMESEDDWKGRLSVLMEQAGTVDFDFVSLFPKHTYKNRPNGLRKDLAEMLAAMKPGFLRFPGGCLVHDGSLVPTDRDSMYRWKNSIGPLTERPARRNNWGYNQTLGLGFYEYFLLAEDIGAQPLPVLPAAYDPHHQRKVPLEELQPWINDALDLIEFANGDETTPWGRIRAEMGHPAPFNLKYIAIGNEEVGEGFTERYPYFHRAIRERYPDIRIIGSGSPFAAGSEYERGWACSRECGSDLVDEHYYMNTDWMIANTDRYDSFSSEGPKVFLGEYASWGNKWYNALVEAAFMTGLERNAAAVGLACYAPLLANADYVNWRPDMIWFDNHQVWGSANYYVQKLFMHHQGTHRLEYRVEEPAAEADARRKKEQRLLEKAKPVSGGLWFRGNEADALFTGITVVNDETGERLALGDVDYRREEAGGRADPEPGVEAGRIPDDWTAYTVTCRAKELSGYKGFLVGIGEKANHFLVTVGGWQNLDISLEHFVKGKGACLCEAMFQVEKDREYELKLTVRQRLISVWADDVKYLEAEDRVAVSKPLYISASADEPSGDVILKVVNLQKKAQYAGFMLEGLGGGAHDAEVYSMAYPANAENTRRNPLTVVPAEGRERISGAAFEREFPPLSLTVIRIRR